MIKLDLITGFLGSGKTTFIHEYAKYLHSLGYKVGIIINDLGAINIDMMLLSDLEKLDIEILQVTSCCPGDEAYRRRFVSKLINLKLRGYNYLLIEPSGAFDINTFFDILNDDMISDFEIKPGIISIVDPNLLFLNENNLYVSQLASSSYIIVSRDNNYKLEDIKERINSIFSLKKINRRVNKENILISKKDDFSDIDFIRLNNASYFSEYLNIKNDEYESIFLLEPIDSFSVICEKCNLMFNDMAFGNIIRIKGFIKDKDIYKEINFTKNERSIKEKQVGQNVIIIVGKNLNNKLINELVKTKIGL